MPWLITTSGWPVLTAHLAGAIARVVVDPVVGGAATVAALALVVALLLRARARRLRPDRRST